MLDETAWEEIATALCHAADRLDGLANSWNDFRGRPMGHDWSHGDAEAKDNRKRAARLRILAFNVADVAMGEQTVQEKPETESPNIDLEMVECAFCERLIPVAEAELRDDTLGEGAQYEEP